MVYYYYYYYYYYYLILISYFLFESFFVLLACLVFVFLPHNFNHVLCPKVKTSYFRRMLALVLVASSSPFSVLHGRWKRKRLIRLTHECCICINEGVSQSYVGKIVVSLLPIPTMTMSGGKVLRFPSWVNVWWGRSKVMRV
jgi:hypothetical protein